MRCKKIGLLLVLITVGVATLFTGCGKKDENVMNEKVTNDAVSVVEEKEETSSSSIELNEDMIAGAESEGISKAEMLKIITVMTANDAQKYGVSIEEYVKVIEKQGLTPYTAQKQVADMMGVTVTALYNQENTVGKVTSAMSKEERESYKNIATLTKTIEETELIPAEATNEVTGNIEELLLYEVWTIESRTEEKDGVEIFYHSKEGYEDLIAYFKNTLDGTDEYSYMYSDVATTIIGTINNKTISVAVHNLTKYDPDRKANGVTIVY